METPPEGPGAFESALLASRKPLHAALRRRGVEESLAQDVAQETVLRALRARDRFDGHREIMPWLLTISMRLLQDRGRRRRELDPVAEAEDRSAAEPWARAAEREERRRLRRALRHLSPAERRVVGLFYRRGLSVRAVARQLGVAPGTVKSHLHRARERLAALLAEPGDRRHE